LKTKNPFPENEEARKTDFLIFQDVILQELAPMLFKPVAGVSLGTVPPPLLIRLDILFHIQL
jgi:hypothetical protein